MKSLNTAVFSYINTFSTTHGNQSPRARALRELVMDQLVAAAFQAVETVVNPSGDVLPDEYIDAALCHGVELAEEIMLIVQDGVIMMHSPTFDGVHSCEECIAADALAAARESLYMEDQTETVG